MTSTTAIDVASSARATPRLGRRRFTVAQAMANREYRAVGGVVLAVLLLSLKAAYNGAFWRAAGSAVVIGPGG